MATEISTVDVKPVATRPVDAVGNLHEIANACAPIVKKTAVTIQKRRYVCVEGWQVIATAHGCVLSAGEVKREKSGFSAVGKVIRMSDGVELCRAEGFVGDDEKTWGKRDEYAKRAMAQTRAMSRAARSAFAAVVVLIGDDLATTPAEEVPPGGFAPKATQPVPDVYSMAVAAIGKAKTGDDLDAMSALVASRFNEGKLTKEECVYLQQLCEDRKGAITQQFGEDGKPV